MNATMSGLIAVVLLSTCLGGTGPFGGEIIIKGDVLTYSVFDQSEGASISRNQIHLDMEADSINTPNVDSDACLYWVLLRVYEEDNPQTYAKLFTHHQEGTLEQSYIEFKGVTTMTDHPSEKMVLAELVDFQPAPAGDHWSDEYCSNHGH